MTPEKDHEINQFLNRCSGEELLRVIEYAANRLERRLKPDDAVQLTDAEKLMNTIDAVHSIRRRLNLGLVEAKAIWDARKR